MPLLRALGAAFGALVLASAAQAGGSVTVTFVEPARFRDANDSSWRPDVHLATLRRHIEEAAGPLVPDGQALRVEVLDVDLAGEMRHAGPVPPLRVMRGAADWPRIELRYVLEAPGQPARSGRATLQDLNYLQRAPGLRPGIELPYERRMIDEWCRTALAPN